jgi:hypothetical protein
MTGRVVTGFFAAALTSATLACTSSNPAVPTPPPISNTVPEATLKATPPVPVSPANDIVLGGRPYILAANAATTPAAPGVALQYRFQIFDGSGALIEEGLANGPNWTVVRSLTNSTRHTWRVRAEYLGQGGPWSASFAFVTPERLGTECGPPNHYDPISIIQCHRDRFGGRLEPADLLSIMRGVALDFNVAEVPGGPFGILRKGSGNNCEGFSCDIICAGQGSGQDQFDILLDEEFAQWRFEVDEPRTDVCEYQLP